jgi:cytochrome oxidase Cu insertion factor (SCO1/SenC/PrrC family)
MRKISLAFSLLLLLIVSVSFAQLGPKDGAGLSPTDLERVKVGSPAPDFTLEGMDGKQTALSDYRGKKSVVLVFYRGHW